MRDDVFSQMLVQLKIANRLLAAQLRRNMGQKELVNLLASVASPKDIAQVLDTTPATVTTTLARLKKAAIDSGEKESNEKGKKQRLLPEP